MTIKKYTGQTKEEAIKNAKDDLGENAEIMNVKEIKKGGFLGMGKKKAYEVTATIDEDLVSNDVSNVKANANSFNKGHFDAVAGDDVSPFYDKEKEAAELEETKKQFAALSEVFRKSEMQDSKTDSATSSSILSENNKAINKAGDLDERFVVQNKASKNVYQENKRVEKQIEKNETIIQKGKSGNNTKFIKTLYNTLLDNEVDEKYINQLMDDMEKVLKNGNNVNYLISNVYQKMILKLGQPSQITAGKKRPKVVFFIGSTGVGKTTTIAKIASQLKLEQKKEIALVTMDTYRLGAKDQLEEYASILQIPMKVILKPSQISEEIEKLKKFDVVLVDTSGFSHRNNEMRENVVELLDSLDEKFEREIYLVLSATTKYKDLKEIVDSYKSFTTFNMIFTKLDETSSFGNIFNLKLYSECNLSYVTNGQNVPDDIEVLDMQKLVKHLLGGTN